MRPTISDERRFDPAKARENAVEEKGKKAIGRPYTCRSPGYYLLEGTMHRAVQRPSERR